MSELSRYLFLAGAAPFVVLGALHALATPFATGDRKGLSPADPATAEAMAGTRLLMTKRTDVWLCWVGFNLSHSLGAFAFGAFALVVGRSASSFASQAAFAAPLAVAVSGGFLAIGLRCWFRTPIAGCAFACGCFALSLGLRLAGV